MTRFRIALALWLALMLACVAIVARTTFTADLSAFLPRNPSAQQQVLVDQLRQGFSSRFILVGIEGGSRQQRIEASRGLAAELRRLPEFASVANGDPEGLARDRDFLWRNRYLLSPAVSSAGFTAEELHQRLEEDLQMLASPAGALLKSFLPADPTREMLSLLDQLGAPGARSSGGVWVSSDERRALLVVQTRAPAYDTDAQAHSIEAINGAFRQAAKSPELKVLLSGPAVFSVDVRQRIEGDARLFATIATLVVGSMLLALYRSVRVLGLGLLPVASGALAGIAAVSLAFGSVHGITLGFGVTLMGEGVDYAIYLFTRVVPGEKPRFTFERIWPTLRLGVLTSICGFSAMLVSGFSGLSQLGLLSIVGLVVAALVAREILPSLLPAGFSVPAAGRLGPALALLVGRAHVLRIPLGVAAAVCLGVLAFNFNDLWADDISRLSPVSADKVRIDQELRSELGAPDIRHLVVLRAPDQEAALQASEQMAALLRPLIDQDRIAGFDSPATALPSRKTQLERQQALPSSDVLRANLAQALKGLPFRAGLFDPFLRDVEAARTAPLVSRESLEGTHFAASVNALLNPGGDGMVSVLSLRGVRDAAAVEATVEKVDGAVMLDLKRDSQSLYRAYRTEAVTHCLLGLSAIVVLLALALRSWRRVANVMLPLLASVLVTMGLLVLGGAALSIFHLIGLVLVVAIGSNYSLFFDRQAPAPEDGERTIVSLVLANLSTVLTFGLLGLSSVPVLHALGSTVAMGALMALAFSAVLMGPSVTR